MANIPEGDNGFRIVREWVGNVCYDLGDYFPEPVDSSMRCFMIACTLAFDLDRENTRDFVPHTPMYRWSLWPRFLSRKRGKFATRDFVAFVTAGAHGLLTFSSWYLQCVRWDMNPRVSLLICLLSTVLRRWLSFDLIVLCDLTERLSGLFIMAHRVDSCGGVLHNVTMPRSWFINLILPDTDLRKDTTTFSMFVSTIIEIMQRIDAQVQRYLASAPDTGEQFTADGIRTTDLTGPLYIARM